jgi:hypothetical protein
MLVMDRRGGTCQVVNLIDLQVERKGHVMADDLESTMVNDAFDVATCASKIIIDTDDISPLVEQTLTQMGAEKSGSARHQYPRLKMQCSSPIVHFSANLHDGGTREKHVSCPAAIFMTLMALPGDLTATLLMRFNFNPRPDLWSK